MFPLIVSLSLSEMFLLHSFFRMSVGAFFLRFVPLLASPAQYLPTQRNRRRQNIAEKVTRQTGSLTSGETMI